MASVSPRQRDAYREERRNSDISLSTDVRPALPTYEQSTDPNFNKQNLQPARLLSTKVAILLYVALYTALAISGWAIVCQAAFKPIDRIPFVFNPRSLRAAKVLTSIAGLLTIPMTSAACAYAAANYTQFSPRRRNDLTLRQTLALANNGWTDPKVLLSLLSPWLSQKQGSLLLWFAIVLNVIGFVVYPLQQLLVGLETVMVPQIHKTIQVADIPVLYSEEALASPDQGEVSMTLRSTLSSTHFEDPQSHLWQSQIANCPDEHSSSYSWCSNFQGAESLRFYDYPNLRDPFVAPLRYGFSTGTERQLAPRFNSSVTYVKVPADEFTEKCSDADYFSVDYHFSESYRTCDLEACMPGDLSLSPFKDQRAPQHIEEVLYLNVSTYDDDMSEPTAYKAVMRTTLGFFELPNYMNGEACGPLLDAELTDPAMSQYRSQFTDKAGSYDDLDVSTERPYGLASVPGKGPLAEIAVALFGNGSFIDIRQKSDYTKVFPEYDRTPSFCTLAPPMSNLISTFNSRCSRAEDLDQDVSEFVYMFGQPEDMAQQLTSAAVLANDLRLSVIRDNSGLLQITHNKGLPFQRPTMSRSTMIAITVLLATYLGSIYLLAFYASFQRSWTEKLDAFAMMRMGAALSDRGDLFAVTARFRTREESLDKLPGYVGDVKPEAEVGQLGVGAQGPLARKRKYHVSRI